MQEVKIVIIRIKTPNNGISSLKIYYEITKKTIIVILSSKEIMSLAIED